jgi:hypothetical protein
MSVRRKPIFVVGQHCRVQCGNHRHCRVITIRTTSKHCHKPRPCSPPDTPCHPCPPLGPGSMTPVMGLTLQQILPQQTTDPGQITLGEIFTSLYPGFPSLLFPSSQQGNSSDPSSTQLVAPRTSDPYQQTLRALLICIVRLTLSQLFPNGVNNPTFYDILYALFNLTLGQAISPCGYFYTLPTPMMTQAPSTIPNFPVNSTLAQKLELIKHMAQQENVNTIVKAITK